MIKNANKGNKIKNKKDMGREIYKLLLYARENKKAKMEQETNSNRNRKLGGKMKQKELRINKKLPEIILPENKNEMLIEWYNKDLRFQDQIPKVFERGYLTLENNFFGLEKDNIFKNNFSALAKAYNTTYRTIENAFNDFTKLTKNTIIYFEFKDNFLIIEIYLNKKNITQLTIDLNEIDKSKPNPQLEEKVREMFLENKNFQEIYTYCCFILLSTSLWYIATTTKTTKYYREGYQPKYFYEKKEIINVKRNKYITTPIYDMKKIKRVKVEGLIKRRKGWTYSHSFQVHGHYRHYKSGKVIFIEPFIKGKGKEELSQKIILSPKEV